MSSLDYLDLCRLCLVKDSVSVPIFEGEGDVRQIFLKIAACLPVKVAREDKLPKKICDDCVYKVELLYQFWNTTANAEKQLLQWLGEVGLEDKQGYVTGVLNPSTMKQEESSPAGLGGVAMQVNAAQQPGIGMGVIDNMGLGMPLMISGTAPQQLAVVPMDTSAVPVQPVHQALPGPSNQPGHDQLSQSQPNPATRLPEEEEETSEEEENSDDDCDGDDGLPVKEESEEDPGNSRTIEPTTFVNVSLACDEAGPSGLQQQKIAEIPEMSMPQTVDGDPKSGIDRWRMKLKKLLATECKTEPRDDFAKDPKPEIENGLSKGSDGAGTVEEDPLFDSRLIKEPLSPEAIDAIDSLEEDSGLIGEPRQPDYGRFQTEFNCVICHREFLYRGNLQKHMRSHSTRRPFSCSQCPKKFRTCYDQRKHATCHDEGLSYTCHICKFKCKSKQALKNHKVRKHEDIEYRYTCDKCSKQYKVRSDLTNHIKCYHTENPPLVCEICGKSFKTLGTMGAHRRSHRKTSVHPFSCTICKQRFKSEHNLNNHLLVHEKGFECKECGMLFDNTKNLGYHRRVKHRNFEANVCSICEKPFRSRGSLRTHILTHTGERPYKCDQCGESFTQRSSMMRHRRSHPGRFSPPPPTPIGAIIKEIEEKELAKK